MTDILARISYRDGSVELARLTPEAPGFVAKGSQTQLEVAITYLRLGVEHILFGFDQLLFVIALLLLIQNGWKLKTITALPLPTASPFQPQHSVTSTCLRSRSRRRLH
jgi:hypothetical protein